VIWTQVRSDVDPTVAAASSLVTGVSFLVLLGLVSARRRANVPG
jgi:ABC-type spermidine/putrescine transport system permease subunit II